VQKSGRVRPKSNTPCRDGEKLTRFLEHPILELSNNLADNSIRPIALGRNYAQSAIMCSL
jgi:hypothetical protein